ncbi:uncharacterized protein AB675_2517 [Cyphellophora attinorum]|uniref:Uncharacterized protein n=1 Tax=Cyphellophora attinorum TaxID=1664694 RepID=A0A0N1HAT0_9EURO|nr:uncharacterized protein AB675_2517 [Phialophora attinorum]KPI45270.1 hypothetical protein AB675_2517 [Phialophora attinorum]
MVRKCDVSVGSCVWLPADAGERDPAAYKASGLSEDLLDHPVLVVGSPDGPAEYVWILIMTSSHPEPTKLLPIRRWILNKETGQDEVDICPSCKRNGRQDQALAYSNVQKSIDGSHDTKGKFSHVCTDRVFEVSPQMLRYDSKAIEECYWDTFKMPYRLDAPSIHAVQSKTLALRQALIKNSRGIVPCSNPRGGKLHYGPDHDCTVPPIGLITIGQVLKVYGANADTASPKPQIFFCLVTSISGDYKQAMIFNVIDCDIDGANATVDDGTRRHYCLSTGDLQGHTELLSQERAEDSGRSKRTILIDLEARSEVNVSALKPLDYIEPDHGPASLHRSCYLSCEAQQRLKLVFGSHLTDFGRPRRFSGAPIAGVKFSSEAYRPESPSTTDKASISSSETSTSSTNTAVSSGTGPGSSLQSSIVKAAVMAPPISATKTINGHIQCGQVLRGRIGPAVPRKPQSTRDQQIEAHVVVVKINNDGQHAVVCRLGSLKPANAAAEKSSDELHKRISGRDPPSFIPLLGAHNPVEYYTTVFRLEEGANITLVPNLFVQVSAFHVAKVNGRSRRETVAEVAQSILGAAYKQATKLLKYGSKGEELAMGRPHTGGHDVCVS